MDCPRGAALESLLRLRIERCVSRFEVRFLQIPGDAQNMNQFAQQVAVPEARA